MTRRPENPTAGGATPSVRAGASASDRNEGGDFPGAYPVQILHIGGSAADVAITELVGHGESGGEDGAGGVGATACTGPGATA